MRITDPWPNWRSIWVTAACRAASLAFASLAPAPFFEPLSERGVVFFSFAIVFITSSPPSAGGNSSSARDAYSAPLGRKLER